MRIVVTEERPSRDLARTGVGLLLLDTPIEAPEHNPEPAAGPDNLAYAIYTSGSTGKPKGVLISHANVGRLFDSTNSWFGFGPEDVWTLFHSYAFDFSVWEVWGALLYGGRLVIVPYLVSRSPAVPQAATERARQRAQPDALGVPPADAGRSRRTSAEH